MSEKRECLFWFDIKCVLNVKYCFLLLFGCLLQSTGLGEFREEQKRKELAAIANDEVGNINSFAMERGGVHCMQHHNIFSRHRVA